MNKIALSLTTTLLLTSSIEAKVPRQLDTILVTAQKTEESLKEIPMAISVFDEYSIADKKIENIQDLTNYVSSFFLFNTNDNGAASPTIRGVHSDYRTRSSAVSMYIDGIPILSTIAYNTFLYDIERIEVLKGPQGTLYGKNTEVGVINVITKKPNNETKGKIKATLGSDNKKELAFNVSGAILKDKFYMGISAKHYEKDGFINNTYKNEKENDQEHKYAKIHLRWTPTDNLEASLISSKIKYDNGATKIGRMNDKNREVASDLNTNQKPEVLLNALNINYNISDNLSLSSTTAHRKYDEIQASDWDFTSDYAKRFHVIVDSTYKTLSEELKLNYKNKNIKLVSGLFLQKEDIHENRVNDKYWLPSIATTINDRKSDSIGLFSHITYKLNDKLSILGGLRYDKVEQEYKDSTQTIKNNENEVSPKIGLTYDFSKDMMSYVTISKGYRTGGFNAVDGYSKTFDKETLYSYEIGLKGTKLNNRLIYDLAIYYMDIDDMQVDFYPDGGATVVRTNAAKATSKGIETSLNFQATDAINLFMGASYNNVKFDEYHNGKVNYSGNKNTFAPKYNFNLGVTYRAEQGYYASTDISGYGDMYLDSANKYKRDAYELVNAKIGYESDNYDIYLYGKNIFDKEYDLNGLWGGVYNVYSPPRQIGVQLAYKF